MKLIETNGDIKFYEDEKGKLFQQIQDGDIFKVRNGNIGYKTIKQVNGYTIKYETNGTVGFVIFKDKTPLEDRIWTLKDAERIAKEM